MVLAPATPSWHILRRSQPGKMRWPCWWTCPPPVSGEPHCEALLHPARVGVNKQKISHTYTPICIQCHTIILLSWINSQSTTSWDKFPDWIMIILSEQFGTNLSFTINHRRFRALLNWFSQLWASKCCRDFWDCTYCSHTDLEKQSDSNRRKSIICSD